MSAYGRWLLKAAKAELVRLVVTGKITNAERRSLERKLIAHLLSTKSL